MNLYKIVFDRQGGPELQGILVSSANKHTATKAALDFAAEDYPDEVARDELVKTSCEWICSTPDDVAQWA